MALISYERFFFHCERRCAHTFPLHNYLVATSPHALHLLHSPTTRKNSYLVGVSTTRIMKSAVSWLLSEAGTAHTSILREYMNTEYSSTFIDE